MNASESIHLAHSVSRKHGGNVHVRAYVLRDGWRHSHAIGNADSRAEAEAIVLEKIAAVYRRDRIDCPADVINHGKLADVMVSHWMFGEGK
jgi:hypothetical protein